MNNEQLEKGRKLAESIKEHQNQITKWEQAKGIYTIRLSETETNRSDDINNVWADWIDFKIVKILTLEALKNKLTELETEFKNL